MKYFNILYREIKIADFGTSKRLAGLHLCTESSVGKKISSQKNLDKDSILLGTLRYMCPDVVSVPLMGYGPEVDDLKIISFDLCLIQVDIWSVGCTVIEMATGKSPFHNIEDQYLLLFKLGSEKQPPQIPSELSDVAKDFLAK